MFDQPSFRLDVPKCARCGQDHRVVVHGLSAPMGPNRHWMVCPLTGDPVLLDLQPAATASVPAEVKECVVGEFEFEIGDRVCMVHSLECGVVIGRAEYDEDEPRYLVRYCAGDGRQVECWWQESAIGHVDDEETEEEPPPAAGEGDGIAATVNVDVSAIRQKVVEAIVPAINGLAAVLERTITDELTRFMENARSRT